MVYFALNVLVLESFAFGDLHHPFSHFCHQRKVKARWSWRCVVKDPTLFPVLVLPFIWELTSSGGRGGKNSELGVIDTTESIELWELTSSSASFVFTIGISTSLD